MTFVRVFDNGICAYKARVDSIIEHADVINELTDSERFKLCLKFL